VNGDEVGMETVNLLDARIARLRQARRMRSGTFCNEAATGVTDGTSAACDGDVNAPEGD
jgi:hypothetical protein